MNLAPYLAIQVNKFVKILSIEDLSGVNGKV